jgi:hypothetical protein
MRGGRDQIRLFWNGVLTHASARTRAIFGSFAAVPRGLRRKKLVERLNLGELSLMDFGDPYRDRRSRVIHINMPNVGIDSRK